MIRNLSYHTLELKLEMIQVTGRSFSWPRRLKLRGIGSQRYLVVEASPTLAQLFQRDNAANFCNIELRQGGIILRFRSRQEAFGWLVPYRHLSIYKSNHTLALYGEGEFVRLKAAQNATLDLRFIQKLVDLKSEHADQGDLWNFQ